MQGMIVAVVVVAALIFLLKNLRRQVLTGEEKKCEACAVNEIAKQQGKKNRV